MRRITGALSQPSFAWYISGSSIALIGIWAQRLTIGWLTWELTGSGFWLGVVAFADLFPTVIISPFAGVLADRVNRHRMMFITQSLGMLQAFSLAALFYLDLLTIWALVGLTLFIGIVWAFNTAARLSLVPNLMEREYVSSAIGMDSAVFNIARFIGPAVAGFLYDAVGAGMSFLINGVTFSIFLLCLLKARMIRDERAGRGRGNIFRQATEGFRYAMAHAGIGPALLVLLAVAVGLKPALELLPGITGDVYRLGASGLGTLMSAAAAGATISAIWLAQRGTPIGLTRIVVTGVFLGGVSLFAFTATDIYALGLLGAFFMGAFITLVGTGTQTLMQNSVDGAMRGRVMSLYGMIYRGGPAIGALAMGSAAEQFGFQASLAVGGILCVAVFFWLYPRLSAMIPALERDPDRERDC
jgi:MFS family permease